MRIGSLSSCLGTFELGLVWAGVGSVEWQVEEDEFCRSVLAKHWPETEQFDVAGDPIGEVDVACVGRHDDAAWGEHVRVLRRLRPRLVALEHRADRSAVGLRRVLGDLAEAGYDAEWRGLCATAVGAPVRRERLYVVAWQPVPGHERAAGGSAPGVGAAGREDEAQPRLVRGGPGVAAGIHRWPAAPEEASHESEPARFLLVDHDVTRAKRLAALDRATVPQVAHLVGRWLLHVGQREGLVA